MKKTKKHNIKNISFLALTFGALCLAGCNAVESSNSNIVEEMPQTYVMQQKSVMPKRENENSLTIKGTYTAADFIRVAEHYTDWNLSQETESQEEYTIEGFEYSYQSRGQTQTGTSIKIVHYNGMDGGDRVANALIFKYVTTFNDNICRINLATQQYFTASDEVETTMSVYNDTFKQLLDNTYVEPPAPMGEQITDTIESGLGMIGTLATELLAGFGALFYVNNQLTPFAIFSLVFLGIAITFAIIKLCLNVVRSNTGA